MAKLGVVCANIGRRPSPSKMDENRPGIFISKNDLKLSFNADNFRLIYDNSWSSSEFVRLCTLDLFIEIIIFDLRLSFKSLGVDLGPFLKWIFWAGFGGAGCRPPQITIYSHFARTKWSRIKDLFAARFQF